MGLVSLLLLTAYTLQTKLECEDCPVVRVQQGLLRGRVLTSIRNGENFLGFLGIPYAKPPIGQLRFKEPLPPESWDGTRDATAEGSLCPQKEGFVRILFGADLNVTLGSEDCLFLNVYTPKLPTEGEQLKATMVFIHGGAFTFGSGSRFFYNPDFFMDQDVVIVTFNYRLGALGFLSTGDEVIPGNAGLKDQVMALQWIQKNIAQFGGDPNKVTLFGFSAGATSVQYHTLSPMSKGLFHSAIAQSGSVINRWAFSASPRTYAFRLGALLGLQSNNSQELTAFLNKAKYQDIVLATDDLLTREEKPAGYGYPFYPCVDNQSRGAVFLPANPQQLLDSGQFYRLPYLTGVNSQEGIFLILVLREFALSLPNGLEIINREFERALPEDFPIPRNTSLSREFASQVKSFYFGDRNVSRETLPQFADLVTDVWFLKDVMSAARKIALRSSPVYFYHFAFDGPWRELKLLLGADSIPGVAHSDEMPYIMPSAITLLLMNPYDVGASTTSRRIVKMWANFAKTGNPTPGEDPLLMNVTWTPFTNESPDYLNIDKELEMRSNLHPERLAFWKSLYEKARSFQINI